jgi:hypothetical protein
MSNFLTLIVLAMLYFLPYGIANARKHNTNGVFIVNLLLGWTVVGWIIALVMACGNNAKQAA